MNDTNNPNVQGYTLIRSPEALRERYPLSQQAVDRIQSYRDTVKRILDGDDHRLLVVVGPCSLHDTEAALDYAKRLAALSAAVSDTLFIVMRAYFEKPRTTVGWKGLINDPHMDGSFAVEEGLEKARSLLVELSELGLPLATEALDPIATQYIQDCISWTAIGARTTESQTHREMASGLPSPIGFKNGTDGGFTVAINALQAISHAHSYLNIAPNGQVAIVRSNGNCGHIVLRGGNGKPNYDAESVAAAEQALAKASMPADLMVDCSHANSSKDPANQPVVLEDVVKQIEQGNRSIMGVMIESNINWGAQPLTCDLSALEYGVSITDGCIDWSTTEKCLYDMADRLKGILPARQRHA
ncbi:MULTISPECIES: 3-deoxy-7-phosphoheptulonate synthase [unclassified Zymobacter]|uniref:3-deoxy-7-phosphoheptulonate synthase n=1 Tax=unclassified Zymobacter TaxID=3048685 RepID=UPI0039C2629E